MDNKERKRIIFLAYLYRYFLPILGIPFLAFLLFFVIPGHQIMDALGSSVILFALYNLIGCLCRWRHVYCAYQDIYHRKMTPEKIDWNSVNKSEVFGISAVFTVLGVLFIVFG